MTDRQPHVTQQLPWYRYPWPWVAIAIPAVAVAGGLFTLYLAISHPDPLVVEEHRYERLRSELLADPVGAPTADDTEAVDGSTQDERERAD